MSALNSSATTSHRSTVEGSIVDSAVNFTKTYGDAGGEATYQGVLNPATRTISGAWTAGLNGGSFEMSWRSADQHPPATAASQTNARQETSAPAPPTQETLTQEMAANLIFAGLPHPECTLEYRVGEANGTSGMQDARVFWTWLESNVVHGRNYHVVSDGPGTSGYFNDRRIMLNDRQGNQLEIQTILNQNNGFAKIRFCPFFPSGVNVLDRSFSEDRKVALVIYTVSLVRSDLTNGLISAGFNLQVAPRRQLKGVRYYEDWMRQAGKSKRSND